MASRAAENRRYATRRTLLILLMGSKCRYCPERRPWRLEFHHTRPRAWSPHKTSRNRRLQRYIRDYGNGCLVLACSKCNKRQGKPRAGETEAAAGAGEEIPF